MTDTTTPPIIIAQRARQLDDRNVFVMTVDEVTRLIRIYGEQEYLRGVEHGTNHPWREDMGH